MQRSLQRLRTNAFVVLGRVGMDLYADPVGARVQGAQSFRCALGGSAGNIAVALARQGAKVSLLTRLSADAVGDYCRSELARYGVGCELIAVETGEARTSLAVTETVADGCQVVLYRNGAADFRLNPEDAEKVDFAEIGALVVTGTSLAREPSRSAAWAALRLAQTAGSLVVFDIDYRAYSWDDPEQARRVCTEFARACDIVIGNDEEYALLAEGFDNGWKFARTLAEGHPLVSIYKRGAKGSDCFTRAEAFQTGIFPVKALKPMGAGDGFMGGLLAALAQGHPLETAVRRGSATAAIVVSGFGCSPASPTTAELNAFLDQNREISCI